MGCCSSRARRQRRAPVPPPDAVPFQDNQPRPDAACRRHRGRPSVAHLCALQKKRLDFSRSWKMSVTLRRQGQSETLGMMSIVKWRWMFLRVCYADEHHENSELLKYLPLTSLSLPLPLDLPCRLPRFVLSASD